MAIRAIDAVKLYLATYTGLETDAPLWANHLGVETKEYSIVPLPGNRIIEQYLNGGYTREFDFAFQSVESTRDELERLKSIGFYEALADWFEAQTLAGIFPTLESPKLAEKIEALDWGFLLQQGESETGIYQVQCKLTYYE